MSYLKKSIANFTLPDEGTESPFKEITFVELQREEASKLVEKYNKVSCLLNLTMNLLLPHFKILIKMCESVINLSILKYRMPKKKDLERKMKTSKIKRCEETKWEQ